MAQWLEARPSRRRTGTPLPSARKGGVSLDKWPAGASGLRRRCVSAPDVARARKPRFTPSRSLIRSVNTHEAPCAGSCAKNGAGDGQPSKAHCIPSLPAQALFLQAIPLIVCSYGNVRGQQTSLCCSWCKTPGAQSQRGQKYKELSEVRNLMIRKIQTPRKLSQTS